MVVVKSLIKVRPATRVAEPVVGPHQLRHDLALLQLPHVASPPILVGDAVGLLQPAQPHL